MLPDRSFLIGQNLWKMPKLKISNATFLAIFKHCAEEATEVVSLKRVQEVLPLVVALLGDMPPPAPRRLACLVLSSSTGCSNKFGISSMCLEF